MNASLLPRHHCVGLSSRAFHVLRSSLERDNGLQTAAYLQEAGFASGEDLYNAFVSRVRDVYQVDSPADLDSAFLSEALSAHFGEFGWGSLRSTPLSAAVLALDSEDWAEAAPEGGGQYPSCHLTSGLLSDFLGRMSGEPVAVMEVECRSRGDDRCRFLVGSPESLAIVYNRMVHGATYAEASRSWEASAPEELDVT
jgi:predicted hydrocarbon binding protein